MEAIIILMLKCLLLGIIWAALLIPVIFNRGGWLKYLVTVLIFKQLPTISNIKLPFLIFEQSNYFLYKVTI